MFIQDLNSNMAADAFLIDEEVSWSDSIAQEANIDKV